jgi:hypothetical protein
MDRRANRVFISYRRDDAAGYAGRLEEALEKRLGHGSVFRDVLDIPPGEDFVAAIRARLAGAQAVLVLIGPRWAGGEAPGPRRIGDGEDELPTIEHTPSTSTRAGMVRSPVNGTGAVGHSEKKRLQRRSCVVDRNGTVPPKRDAQLPRIAAWCSAIHSPIASSRSTASGGNEPSPFGPTLRRRLPPFDAVSTRISTRRLGDFQFWSTAL